MGCANVCFHLRTCRRNMMQNLFNGCFVVVSSHRTAARCLLKRSFHVTNRIHLPSLSHLKSRGVIQLSGKDTAEFLQGLVTNNVWQLLEKRPSVQYNMMLNVQGRIMYDLFVYNISKSESDNIIFLAEADALATQDLVQIFRKYKLRKKVEISEVSDKYKIWALFDTGAVTPGQGISTISSESQDSRSSVLESDRLQFQDPRVPSFSDRIVTSRDHIDSQLNRVDESQYRSLRYQWGIPEGVADLPVGKCLPLECNLSFMNGVNFQKGCYIGQELTARTFHTGVIRKRLVPVTLSRVADIEPDAMISSKQKGKAAGKFRNSEGLCGICILRLEHLTDDLEVMAKDGQVVSLKAQVPSWWPSTLAGHIS